MPSGKQFRLKVDTIAIETIGGKRVLMRVPAGSIITVKSGSWAYDNRMVDVYWDGRNLVMFAEDIQKRGEPVSEASA